MKKFMCIFILSFVVLFLGIVNTNAEGLVCGTTMRYGSTGENVKALQTLLNEKVGCNLVVDGSYGSATKSCVVKYQQQANIQVDGIAGPETCGMLTGTLEGAIKEYPESKIKKGIVSVDVANVRQLPSVNSKSLGTVKSGRIVRILVDGNEWYKIKVGKTTGYIRKDLLSKNCILLDISDQRLYYFTEGQLLWSTRVVTGNQGNHDTPIGNYTLNPNNFNYIPEKRKQVNDLLGKMKRQIKDNAANHTATKHYINNYGYIPLWVLVKVLSFGIVSELFSILKKEDQYDIVELYDLDVNVFTNYLSSLSNYRNLCAHEDILYNNRTQKSILDTKYHRLLNIPIMDNEYIYGKNDLFSVVIMMKSMIKKDEFDLFEKEISDLIDELDNKLKSIEINKILDCMGFPKNWKELKDIDKKEIF